MPPPDSPLPPGEITIDVKVLGELLIQSGKATARLGAAMFVTGWAIFLEGAFTGNALLEAYGIQLMQAGARAVAAGLAMVVVGKLLKEDPARFDAWRSNQGLNPYVPRAHLGGLAWETKGMHYSVLNACIFGWSCLNHSERAQGARVVGDIVAACLAESSARGYARMAVQQLELVNAWMRAMSRSLPRAWDAGKLDARGTSALIEEVGRHAAWWTQFVPGVSALLDVWLVALASGNRGFDA